VSRKQIAAFVAADVLVRELPNTYRLSGVAPSREHIWIRGHWLRVGSRWDWQAGHWEVRRVGHEWIPIIGLVVALFWPISARQAKGMQSAAYQPVASA